MATIIKLKRGTSTPSTSDITSGEVAVDTSAKKLYINDSGTVKEIGGAGAVTLNSVTTAGASTTTSILLDQGANLIFEGNLANAYETTLTAVEPTADNTVSLPNQSGVLATEGDNLAFSLSLIHI